MRSLQSWISSQTTTTPYYTILKAFSPFHFYTTIAKKLLNSTKHNNNNKALKVLDLVNLNSPKPQLPSNHLRLIQSCLQDLHHHPTQLKSDHTSFNQNLFDEMPDRNICMGTLFFQMNNKGVKTEATTLSCALSSLQCLKTGVQLHCLAIKAGFDEYVYIGSSLISLYGKCGELDDAYNMFEEMPVRNVVSWTAIIVGFAQHWEVEMCLELYNRMRCSSSKPNDFTFTSILSVCTGSGTLGQGKSAHCQVIRLGFESYLHVRNALISMYSKCGNVEEADYIFGRMKKKDLVSWNSMIAGYSEHGLAEKAISMFTEMKKLDIRPDGITFLGVLSSCRHAGLVEHGHIVFNSMIKHGVEPDLDHYSCIIDLLGRAGLVKRAKSFIGKMPINPNAVIWGSLLSSCRQHGDVQIGIEAAENRLMLVPDCVATHVQLVNLYANAGCWEQAAKVRKKMKDRGLRTNPGYSWIEVKNEVYRFRAEDISNDRFHEILAVVDGLVDNMRYYGYLPEFEKEFDLYSTFQL